MGILKNIFGGKDGEAKKEEKKTFLNWIPLRTVEQLNTIKQQSKKESILIFKHSTRCGISSMVIKRFEALFTEKHQNLKVYYLDLLNYRDLSAEVGYTFQVMHQSPQLIIVKNGVTVYHASHYDISLTDLSTFM